MSRIRAGHPRCVQCGKRPRMGHALVQFGWCRDCWGPGYDRPLYYAWHAASIASSTRSDEAQEMWQRVQQRYAAFSAEHILIGWSA